MISEDEVKYDEKKIPASMPARPAGKAAMPKIYMKLCVKCMYCVAACPHNTIEIKAGSPSIMKDFCTGCMVCLRECPVTAIAEEKEE
ncbi:MAG: 4Fe-4S binding protein [Candidatus Aenigmatarchaeota archaeon]